MTRFRTAAFFFTVSLATGGPLLAQAAPADNIPNWPVPAVWSPSVESGGIQTMIDVTHPRLFVGIAPCRIADTRTGQGFSGQAGPPIVASNTTRSFLVAGSPATLPAPPNGCESGAIPTGAEAVSFQFTVVSPTADGNLIAWPAGGVQPQVSVLNWAAGTVALGNGTIVPLSVGGGLSIRLNMAFGQSAHLVIDVNGYFSDTLQTPSNYFELYTNSASSAAATFSNASGVCANACGLFLTVNSGNAIHAQSLETNADTNFGIYGSVGSSGSNSTGVIGYATNAAGATYGVQGWNNSGAFNAAGVLGWDGGGGITTLNVSSGLRGESRNGIGVLGLTHNSEAVKGRLLNPANGVEVASGTLGRSGATNYGVYSSGDAHIAGALTATGTKMFVQPHPLDPSKEIQYVTLEGRHSEVYFRGTARIARGITRIAIPDDFVYVASAGTYSTLVTPVGAMATVAVLSEGEDGIVVQASRNVRIHYVVYAEREAVAHPDPVVENVHFRPEPDRDFLAHLPDSFRELLIRNGTLHPDGTVNLETARRLGWERDRERRATPAPQPAP